MNQNRKTELLNMLKEEPSDVFLHYALGLEYYKENNIQEAIQYFQKSITLDPAYIAAYYQLGSLFMEIDIVDVARNYLTQGLKHAMAKNDSRSIAEISELMEDLD